MGRLKLVFANESQKLIEQIIKERPGAEWGVLLFELDNRTRKILFRVAKKETLIKERARKYVRVFVYGELYLVAGLTRFPMWRASI